MIGFTVWLWISRPLLVNPWEVLSRLKSASIQDSTMTLMAAMLPIVFLACIFLLLALIAICFLAFSNERKHLAIIQRLDADGADPGKNG